MSIRKPTVWMKKWKNEKLFIFLWHEICVQNNYLKKLISADKGCYYLVNYNTIPFLN